jgi:cell wall-associated NlpC family hydrolase
MYEISPEEQAQRDRVIAIAKSWVGTPYHHAARIKGAGVDCLTLLAEVFSEAALIERPEIPHYPPDWMLHREAERYLEGVMKYAQEIDGDPLPGDIVVYRFGRCFAHGAIVVKWPMIISRAFQVQLHVSGCGKSAVA